MKKVLAVLLSLCMLLCLIACETDLTSSTDVSSESTQSEATSSQTSDTTVSETSSTPVSSEESVSESSEIVSSSPVSSENVSSKETSSISSIFENPDEETSSIPSIFVDPDDEIEEEEEEKEEPPKVVATTQNYFKAKSFSKGSGATIDYLFHEPIRDTNKDCPLVIYLHALNNDVNINNFGSSTKLVNSLITLENESKKFSTYTLVPTTPTPSEGWWTDEQLLALIKLIRDLVATYDIDPARIYLTGISMGGMTTCELVDAYPDSFAVAVPLSGCTRMTDPDNAKNTAFRIYHAINDNIVGISSSRGFYQQLKGANHTNVELFEIDSSSHSAPLVAAYEKDFREFFGWMFNQKLSTTKYSAFAK